MFTNAGRSIISKYLLGQTPAFASYIVIGCGAKPGTIASNADIKSPLFESARAKIVSRGYVNDGTDSNLVFTAEIPTDERYAITEIGLFPAQSNNTAGAADSRILAKFNSSEAWKKVSDTSEIQQFTTAFESTISSTPSIPTNPIIVNSDNAGLNVDPRINRLEVPRFLTQSIFKRASSTESIVLSGLNIDLSQNVSTDELKFAYSILNNSAAESSNPGGNITINIDFYSDSVNYYRWTISSQDYTTYGRYQIASTTIGSITAGGGTTPSWKNISKIEISTSYTNTDKNDFWISFDGLRIDAIGEYTSVYDLVAYKIVDNPYLTYNLPIIKDANTSSFIEFRFNVNLGGS